MLVGLNIMKGIKIKNKISRPNISLAIHLRLVDSLLFSDILSSVFLRALDRDSFASVIWADRNFFDSFYGISEICSIFIITVFKISIF